MTSQRRSRVESIVIPVHAVTDGPVEYESGLCIYSNVVNICLISGIVYMGCEQKAVKVELPAEEALQYAANFAQY